MGREAALVKLPRCYPDGNNLTVADILALRWECLADFLARRRRWRPYRKEDEGRVHWLDAGQAAHHMWKLCLKELHYARDNSSTIKRAAGTESPVGATHAGGAPNGGNGIGLLG